jgi:hypothetical protein
MENMPTPEKKTGLLKNLSSYLKKLALTGIFLAGFGEAEGQSCKVTYETPTTPEQAQILLEHTHTIDSLLNVLLTTGKEEGFVEIESQDSAHGDLELAEYFLSPRDLEIINTGYGSKWIRVQETLWFNKAGEVLESRDIRPGDFDPALDETGDEVHQKGLFGGAGNSETGSSSHYIGYKRGPIKHTADVLMTAEEFINQAILLEKKIEAEIEIIK